MYVRPLLSTNQATADAIDHKLLALLYAGLSSEHGKKACACSYLM